MKTETAKQLVVRELANEMPFNKVLSVRKGSGTASNWLYIVTKDAVHMYAKGWIEAKLHSAGMMGRYYSDGGPGDNWNACCRWETPRK